MTQIVIPAGPSHGTVRTALNANRVDAETRLAALEAVGNVTQAELDAVERFTVGPSQFNAYWEGGIIPAATAANAIGGGIVHIGEGEWVQGPIPIYTNVIYQGEGPGATVVKLAANSTPSAGEPYAHVFYTPAKGATPTFSTAISGSYDVAHNGWQIRDMVIDGNKANNLADGGQGIAIYGFGYRLENAYLRNVKRNGIYSDWNPSSPYSAYGLGVGQGNPLAHISHFQVFNYGAAGMAGIKFLGPHDCMFTEGKIWQEDAYADVGFWCSSTGAQYDKIHVYGNNLVGWKHAISQQLFTNIISEGADTQFEIDADHCIINGALMYGFEGTRSNKGINHISGNAPSLMGVNLLNFDTYAINFGHTTGRGHYQMRVSHPGITPTNGIPAYTGTIPATSFVHIMLSSQGALNTAHRVLQFSSEEAISVGAAATDLATVITLANNIRTALNSRNLTKL